MLSPGKLKYDSKGTSARTAFEIDFLFGTDDPLVKLDKNTIPGLDERAQLFVRRVFGLPDISACQTPEEVKSVTEDFESKQAAEERVAQLALHTSLAETFVNVEKVQAKNTCWTMISMTPSFTTCF